MNKEIRRALVWAGITILLALGAKFGHRQGYVDYETMLRIVALNGLWIAWYGNQMPKAVATHPIARKVARVSGWSFVLSGLAYAGLWVFAPTSVALPVGVGVLLAGFAAALGHCFWLATRGVADGRAGHSS